MLENITHLSFSPELSQLECLFLTPPILPEIFIILLILATEQYFIE